ncbi:hypothetical protein GCM10022243_62640 [Saccharothrix violaceirubra]
MLAGAVGDALGASIEFESIDKIRARYGPSGLTDYAPAYGKLGAITDDTQMALFTLEGLVLARERGLNPVESVHAAYLRWLSTQGIQGPAANVPKDGWLLDHEDIHDLRAPGNTCLVALRSGKAGTITNPLNDSKGCGAVMRAAPVALWSDDPAQVFALAAATGALTHGHPSGYLSAGVLAVIVQQLLAGRQLREAVATARAELVLRPDHEEQLVLLDRAVNLAGTRPSPEFIEQNFGGGWVGEEALAIGLHAALAARDLGDALLLAVNHSGDSDSTGVIAGNILGAVAGEQAIPRHWLERLELRDAIAESARRAVAALTLVRG